MYEIGPEPSQDMVGIVEVLTGFAAQCLDTTFAISRDFSPNQCWERITLKSSNMVITLLDFGGDFTASIIVGNQVLETDDPEQVFDILVEAQTLIEGEPQT